MGESDGLACVTDLTREGAEKLDAADLLAPFRDRFVIDDPSVIYMDGNSLGRLPIATERRLAEFIRQEWGGELIRGWDHWLTLPGQVGDRLGAALLGAAPGQVIVSDSTTVNLYKCAVAALDARPDRRVIVTDKENFPSDRYVFEGLAGQRDLTLRMVESDPVDGLTAEVAADAIDEDVALVSFSHVAYASGAIADMNGFGCRIQVDDAGDVVWWGKEGVNVGVSAEVAYYPRHDVTTVVLCSSEQGAWGPIETIEALVLSGALDNQ